MSASATCRLSRLDAEFDEAARQHLKVVLRRPILWAGRAVAVLLIGLLAIGLAARGFRIGPFLVGVVVAFLFFFMGPVVLWFNRRSLRSAPFYGVESFIFIGPSGIDISTPNVGMARVAWVAVQRAVRTSSGFLLYPFGGSFTWLPFSGFSEPADVERVAELLRDHVKSYSVVA